jgi:hypothetical protein
MNSPFVVQQVRDVVGLPEIATSNEAPAKIAALYRRILNRSPDEQELAAARQFVETPPMGSQLGPWEQLAQVLLLTNEVLFVD